MSVRLHLRDTLCLNDYPDLKGIETAEFLELGDGELLSE